MILLVALLLPSLSACGERTNETTAPSDSVTDTTAYEDPIPDLSGHWYDGYEAHISADYNGYLVGQQLYHINDDGALCLLDLTTMEESLICAKEDCTHHKAFCDAYFGYENYYIDGYLYRRENNTLVRCRLDGTEYTKLLTMGELDFGDRLYSNKRVNWFQVTENAIYYTITAEYGVDLGNYNFATKTMNAVVRFDMESGEETLLGEYDEKNVRILAARDHQVLIIQHQAFTTEDYKDPAFDQMHDSSPCTVQVWDAEYGYFITVKEDASGVFSPYKIEDGKLLYANYKDEIRLEQLAELVGMTATSFSRFFKLRTGKTLSDYLIDIRIGYATRMLVDSTMSIAEICYECGFNNLSNFNRIFKKKKDCSPKEFREYYRKKKIIF